jgi:glycosyltransferase involved in cell wall biosynthesis
MKVTHLAHSNKVGGAANFTSRVIDSLCSVGIDNVLIASSVKTETKEVHVISPNGSKTLNFLRAKSCQTLDGKLRLLEKTDQYTYKSPNLIGSLRARELNNLKTDLFNLHWINGGLISIRQIGKIKKPIVWTMLDMWPFLGSEHYLFESDPHRFIDGFTKNNRNPNDIGIDLCRIAWNLKIKYFKNLNLISPSNWLSCKANSSLLFNNQKIEVIPPPIDSNKFSPAIKKIARTRFEIDEHKFVIGFLGGLSGRKGWKFVSELCTDPNLNQNWKFLLGGAPTEKYLEFKEVNRTAILAGKLEKPADLTLFYSSIDVLIVPSTAEAYGLVAQEAQACGVPVLAFSDTGTADVIQDNVTGFIVKERSAKGLLDSLVKLDSLDTEQRNSISINSRNRAINEWSYKVIGDKYLNFYSNILANSC